jgi:hypothetical protein
MGRQNKMCTYSDEVIVILVVYCIYAGRNQVRGHSWAMKGQRAHGTSHAIFWAGCWLPRPETRGDLKNLTFKSFGQSQYLWVMETMWTAE